MANIRADTVNVELIFSPFPANTDSVIRVIATTEWRPEDRLDIRAQSRSVTFIQGMGDPLQSQILILQTAGQTLIENRFGMDGQDLTSNPLDSLSGAWLYNAPTLPFPLPFRAVAQWRPEGFATGPNRVRPQIAIENAEVSNPNGSTGEALQAVSDFALNALAATFAPTDTLLFGPFDDSVAGAPPPDVTDLLNGADINDFIVG